MVILGIHDGHNAISLLKNGKLICSIEERLSKAKNHYGNFNLNQLIAVIPNN